VLTAYESISSDSVAAELLVRVGFPDVDKLSSWGLFFAATALDKFLTDEGLDTTRHDYVKAAREMLKALSAEEKEQLIAIVARAIK